MCKKALLIVLGMSVVLGLAQSTSADVVGYWKFDEGAGTTVRRRVEHRLRPIFLEDVFDPHALGGGDIEINMAVATGVDHRRRISPI